MYSLNPIAARQAEQHSPRITQPGKYKGVFTSAEEVTSANTGTRGITFTFETEDKQTAHFSLWTLSAKGEEFYGHRQLNALMVCLRLKNITPTRGMIRKWDSLARSIIDMSAQVFTDLMNKKIGVLFDTEEYEKQDGQIGIKVVPAGFFDAESHLIASEILDCKVQPQRLAQLTEKLKHRPLKKSNHQPSSSEPYGTTSSQFDDMDDDIPF